MTIVQLPVFNDLSLDTLRMLFGAWGKGTIVIDNSHFIGPLIAGMIQCSDTPPPPCPVHTVPVGLGGKLGQRLKDTHLYISVPNAIGIRDTLLSLYHLEINRWAILGQRRGFNLKASINLFIDNLEMQAGRELAFNYEHARKLFTRDNQRALELYKNFMKRDHKYKIIPI